MLDDDLLKAYFAPDDTSGSAAALKSILDEVASKRIGCAALVQALGEQLTVTDNAIRCKATELLAEVFTEVPQVLIANDVVHMSSFFAARLKDWPCLEGAVKGCSAILRLNETSAGPRCSHASAIEMMQAFAKHVNAQSLAQTLRYNCLQLWLAALKGFGVAAASSNVDLASATVVTVDGEKDPRCLLLVFQCVQAVAWVYQQPGVPQKHLQDNLDSLFEVVSCYFPISFTPPQNDLHKITREDLVSALHTTLCGTPVFAKLCIPLLLEKLSSSLMSAQVDSLALLAQCCKAFGVAGMRESLSAVWLALKSHITGPINIASSGDVAGDQLQAKRDMAERAMECLGHCIRALGTDELSQLVLSDPAVEDLIRHISAVADNPHHRSATNTPVAVSAKIIAAVAASSPSGCLLVCTKQLPELLSQLQQSSTPKPESAALVLSALHIILSQLAATSTKESWDSCAVTSLKTELVATLKQVAQWTTATGAENGVAEAMDIDSSPADDELQLLQVLTWHDLLQFPSSFAILSPEDLQHVAGMLASVVLSAPDEPEPVEAAALWTLHHQDAVSAALAAVETLLANGNVPLVVQQVLPMLSAAVIPSQPTAQQAAVSASTAPTATPLTVVKVLTHLAACNSEVALQLIGHLCPALLRDLATLPLADKQDLVAYTLHQLAQRVAPSLHLPLQASLSTAIMHLVRQLLELSPKQLEGHSWQWSPELLSGAVAAISRLLALCSAGEQAGLSMDVCELLLRCHQPDSSPDSNYVCGSTSLAAAATTALWSGVLSDSSSDTVAETLVDIIIKGQSSALEGVDEAGAAAVALASVLNKWPLVGPDFERRLTTTCQQLLAATSTNSDASARMRAYQGLAWVARALALRGHSGFQTIITQVLEYLSSPQPSTGKEQAEELHVAWHAAQVFQIATSDGASCSGVQLGPPQHAQTKGLWRQRTYMLCHNTVLQRIKDTAAAATTHSAADTAVPTSARDARTTLYFAYACLVKGAALQHLCLQPQDVPAALLASMQCVQQALGAVSKGALLSCLLILSHFLMCEDLRPLLEAHVEQLLAVLIALARLPGAREVREAAYHCLTAAMELPYHYLHPHRQKVLKGAVQGLDDDKRAVREAAIKCRLVWGPA